MLLLLVLILFIKYPIYYEYYTDINVINSKIQDNIVDMTNKINQLNKETDNINNKILPTLNKKLSDDNVNLIFLEKAYNTKLSNAKDQLFIDKSKSINECVKDNEDFKQDTYKLNSKLGELKIDINNMINDMPNMDKRIKDINDEHAAVLKYYTQDIIDFDKLKKRLNECKNKSNTCCREF